MAQLELKGLRKQFGAVEAVGGIDLTVEHEEFVVLVGPSGCGKSTILRMIAGLEEATAGAIRIGDRLVTNTAPKDRNIAMVFQNYALYPHKSVHGNMAFALRAQGLPKADVERRVRQAAAILGLEELMERKPGELSGGQRQRVAMGRAIVRDPAVFLFDEPLSNLDAELRARLRSEIKKLHRKLKATVVYVTHDQIEAMTLADRVVILEPGKDRAGRHADGGLRGAGESLRRRVHRQPRDEPASGRPHERRAGGAPARSPRECRCRSIRATPSRLFPVRRPFSASGPKTSRCCRRESMPRHGSKPRSRRWNRSARSSCFPSRSARMKSWRRFPVARSPQSESGCASDSTWPTRTSSTPQPGARCESTRRRPCGAAPAGLDDLIAGPAHSSPAKN